MMLFEFPFFNSQQLNLDWILEKLATMEDSFVPYVKLDAISADNDTALLSAFNANVDQMPLGFSILHFGVPNEDAVQVFAFCYRTDTDSGTANIYTTGTDITLSVLNMADGVWAAGTAPEYGTTVVANPTLAGTEADLTGLQVGETKYKVPAGGGGGGGVLIVVADMTTMALDKTWQEIADADFPVIRMSGGGQNGASWDPIFDAIDKGESFPDSRYVVQMRTFTYNTQTEEYETSVIDFACASANDYPVLQMGG